MVGYLGYCVERPVGMGRCYRTVDHNNVDSVCFRYTPSGKENGKEPGIFGVQEKNKYVYSVAAEKIGVENMRIWDVHPRLLCRKHLLAEHRELHGLWNILTIHKGTGGYSRHPETLRWVGKRKALYLRHEILQKEFIRRGYNHNSPLDRRYATGVDKQESFINTVAEQRQALKNKACDCFL